MRGFHLHLKGSKATLLEIELLTNSLKGMVSNSLQRKGRLRSLIELNQRSPDKLSINQRNQNMWMVIKEITERIVCQPNQDNVNEKEERSWIQPKGDNSNKSQRILIEVPQYRKTSTKRIPGMTGKDISEDLLVQDQDRVTDKDKK